MTRNPKNGRNLQAKAIKEPILALLLKHESSKALGLTRRKKSKFKERKKKLHICTVECMKLVKKTRNKILEDDELTSSA